MEPRDIAKAVTLGLAGGFAGGLFGVGGGVVVVPGLVLWMALRQHQAHATSVAAIVASSSAAAGRFAFGGELDVAAAAFLFIGAGLGAYLGARLMTRISEVWLARAFVAFALLSAVRLAVGR